MAEFGYQTRIPAMLPSDLDCITQRCLSLFVDALRADESGVRFPELLSVQEAVLAFTSGLGRALMQAFVDVRVEQALTTRALCVCGEKTEALKRQRWSHETLFGPVEVADPYVYCRTCHAHAHPAHAWLGVDRERWSMPVQEAAVDLAADESCEKAVAKLARHHPGVEMERTTALRLLHRHGAEARVFIDEKLRTAVAPVLTGAPPAVVATELEAEYDASMIPVATMESLPEVPGEPPKRTPVRNLPVRRRNARWEEVKASLVQTPDGAQRLTALRPTTELDAAFEDLFSLACLLGWTTTTEVRGLADGAVYIRTRMEEVFVGGSFRFILDRPHCKEHLTEAGEALAPLTGTPAQEWVHTALPKLEAGRAHEVVAELKAAYDLTVQRKAACEALRLAAGYFERNADAVAYANYRAAGWSTASSEVESGHRQTVQARMKIAGAWWHPDGVDDILALRMLRANGWWKEYWTWQRQRWREHAQSLDAHRTAA